MLDKLDNAMTAALREGNQPEFERLAAEAETAHATREARLRAPNALADAARWYVRCGIALFPIRPGEKIPYPGSRGFKDATTSILEVNRWWVKNPSSNIGLPTGHQFDVIDIDSPAGYQSYRDLLDEKILNPAEILGRSITPRGGMHIYVRPTGDGNAASFREGLDYRGLGGYVLAPPSLIGDKRYDWDQPLAALGGGA